MYRWSGSSGKGKESEKALQLLLLFTLLECHCLRGDKRSLAVSSREHSSKDGATRVREQQIKIFVPAEVLEYIERKMLYS